GPVRVATVARPPVIELAVAAGHPHVDRGRRRRSHAGIRPRAEDAAHRRPLAPAGPAPGAVIELAVAAAHVEVDPRAALAGGAEVGRHHAAERRPGGGPRRAVPVELPHALVVAAREQVLAG